MGTWTKDQALEWYKDQEWLVGCNYLPSNSVNQLEMFQLETFDKEISNEDKRILDILMNKLDQKLAFEIGSEILKKKRNTIYKIKIKDEPS